MKVLFVEVDTEHPWGGLASLGPAFIAPVLRRAGHEVAFFRARPEMTESEVIERIAREDAGLVGFSLTTRQWMRGRAIVAALRKAIDVPVVAGGLHPTFSTEEVLGRPGFDYACIGEGELAAVDLANALERGEPTEAIPNVWARGAARPRLRPVVPCLDDLPFMDRALLDEHPGVITMTTQRGCPFPCTYCGARMFNELYDDAGVEYGRRRSIENVLAELHHLRATGPVYWINFIDDTFTIHHPWVQDFCRRYADEFKVGFSLLARVDTVDERLLEKLARAGCKQITYGVESGSERVRREIMKRPIPQQRFKEVFRWTAAHGIRITANYMMGLPGETRADLDATYGLACELEEAFDICYYVFYPYPGTHLFKTCQERGLLPDDYLERPANQRESILKHVDITQDDIAACYERFTELRKRIWIRRSSHVAPEDRGPIIEHVEDVARRG